MRDRLYRSRDERVIFGVAGGVADWLDIDPTLVRLGFALAFVLGGAGLLIYIVMAIVVPEEPVARAAGAPMPASGSGDAPAADAGPGFVDNREARRAARAARRAERDGRGAVIFGAILVLVGGWFLARRYLPFLDGDLLGPAVLIVVGVLLIGGAVGRAGSHRP